MSRSTSLALILITIGLFYTFISPQYSEMNKRRALLNEYDNVIQNVTAIAETRDKLLVSYNSIPKNEIDRLSKILPDKIDTVRLAIDLDSIASRYAIAIKNVQVGNTNDKDSNSLLLP
ncbi:MAG: hypothetical protein AAB758_01930, partial [Patescibacteria group bacterium]